MKKILIYLFLITIFSLGFSLNTFATPLAGWAWSQNVGWISFSSRNCDANGDGLSDGTPAGCPAAGVAIPTYGVTIAADGVMSGHAWSQQIGWISFNLADLTGCPSAPCEARANMVNGEVSGWARVLAHDGGWTGWIRLRSATAPAYGVSINLATRDFFGWAWSNMVTGWISFSSRNCDANGDGLSDGTPAGCPAAGVAIPTYAVRTLNTPPRIDPPLSAEANHCLAPGRHTFSWTFFDPGDTQLAYQIQIATNTAFSPILIDSGRVTSTASHNTRVSFAPVHDFAWNTTFHWRAMAWDSHNVASAWSTTTSFTTPVHRSPNVNFTWTPITPAINEVIQFTDQSICYGPGAGGTEVVPCASWFWEFIVGGSTVATSNLQHPTTTFASAGRHTARLTVTDPSGSGNPALNCTNSRTIDVAAGPPIWIEIPPIIQIRNFIANITNLFNGFRNRLIAF